MSIEKKPNRYLVKALLMSIRTYLKSRSYIVVERNDTLGLKPPYIILSNHVNNLDPFFINSFVEEPICFVAAEPLFHNRLLKRLLDYIGTIPKTKFKNDISTIRGILKAKKHNRIIGLFPEGNSSWDGTTDVMTSGTAKLVKLLNIPVVIVKIAGGHLSHPRWAKRNRKGQISISLIKKWDKDELSDEPVEIIHQKLTDALFYDEMEWQSDKSIQYKGKGLANYLERFLFICPHCHKPNGLYSHEDFFNCNSCGYKVRYSAFGTLEQVNYPIYFKTTKDWNRWQLEFIRNTIFAESWIPVWKDIMNDPVRVFVSNEENILENMSTGRLSWDYKSIMFKSDTGKKYIFKIENIEGLNIHVSNNLDFYYNGKLHRIKFFNPRTSAYKWLKVIEASSKKIILEDRQ